MPYARARTRVALWLALLLGCTKPIPSHTPDPSPPAPLVVAAPDAAADPSPATCNASMFEPTADGVVWSIGGHRVRFRATEEAEGELAYNYRRRTVRIEAVDGGSAALDTSCYTETDCNAPPDADGNERWCLVSHGLHGAASLFELVAQHRPCESPLELLEALAVHSTAPTCFRAALGTYPGAAYSELGELSGIMAEQGVPADVIAAVEAHAKAAEDADRGYRDPQDDAAAVAALRKLRQVLGVYTTTAAAWQVDLLAARALAQLERRHPYTIVGPNEALHDVLSSDEDPWTTVPTAAPWVAGGAR